MAKILLVEDDDFFRSAVKTILELGNHNVTEAANGKIAKDILALDIFDIIVTDIKMPHFDGLELLQWLKDKDSKQIVVLMTGFSHVVETQQAFELGASYFLAKPFSKSDLEKIVTEIDEKLNKDKKPKDENSEIKKKSHLYCKVSIDEFVSRSTLDFELFIFLGTETFVKIANEGAQIDQEKLTKFKEKGVRFLYIKKEDFGKLVGFNLQISKIVTEKSNVPTEKKLQFMRYTGEVLLEKVFVAGLDKTLLSDAKDYLDNFLDVMSGDENMFTLINALNNHTDFLYAHSLGTAIYSNMIAKKMRITASPALMKITLGGLLHDIGKKEIDPAIIVKPRAQLSFEERKLIESHANRGFEILNTMKDMPSDVAQIAYEHHEDILGQGFPRMIGKDEIHPLSKIISVANIFCNYVIQNPHHKLHKPGEAFMKMEIEFKKKLDPNVMTALSEIITDKIKSRDL